MTRPPDPDSPAGRNLRLSRDACEAMRFFTARRLGISMDDVFYADLACDELYLVEMLTALRHWADQHAADYAKADRRARRDFARQLRDAQDNGKEVR